MSCLFDSLSYFISNLNGAQLRKEITDFIQQDPIMIEPNVRLSSLLESDHISIHNYVQEMRQTSTWGSAIEIKAFCEMFQVEVHVELLHEKRTVEFIPKVNQNHNKYIKICWNGNHFTPVK